MRLIEQKFTVRRVLFSRPMSVVYFVIFCFFIYKCLVLIPIWLTAKTKAEQAEVDYEKKVILTKQREKELLDKQTDMGKYRYQKDFFNKLDEGENLIILYSEDQKATGDDELRKMFWWQEFKQNFLVWWRNLELFKK